MSQQIENAIILAAGRGSRLGQGEAGSSKALIRLGEETIIDYQIRALETVGIMNIAVVTGFKAEEVRTHLEGHNAVTYHNDIYAETNSLYSLCLAEETARKGALVLNSDVLFHPALLDKIVNDEAPDAILVDFDNELADEEMKVVVDHGIVNAIAKDLPVRPGMGENVGIIKLSAEGAEPFFRESRRYIDEGQVKAWAPRAIHLLVGRRPFKAIPVDGIPWTEIDFPEDLVHARENVYPLCRAELDKLLT